MLKKEFYLRNTLDVAKELLGCTLCRRLEDGRILKGKIVETEAYTQDEKACHAFRGITKRSKTLFCEGGISYVYFIYGMYHCFNAVTEREGRGSAVLIRALEPLEGLEGTNGPSKLCRAMEITKELNEIDLTNPNSQIWIEEGQKPKEVIQTTRIGIKEATELPWRFYIKDNKWVSKK